MIHTTPDKTPSPQFTAMVSSFFGSAAGNIRSPVWICGLEPGGGFSPDIPIPVSNLAPYSFEDLQCWTADDFFGSFWGDSSPLCWAVAKILVGLKDGRYDSTRFRNRETLRKTLAADNLVGPNGLALVLNAFPISMQGVNQRSKSWQTYRVRLENGTAMPIREWSGLDDYPKYEAFVFANRGQIYASKVQEYRPQIIICCGNQDRHERLFGVKDNQEDLLKSLVPDMLEPYKENRPGKLAIFARSRLFRVPHEGADTSTLVFVVPFPSGSNGLVANVDFDDLTWGIRRIGQAYFGEQNWLKGWRPEGKRDVLTADESKRYADLANERQALHALAEAASFELAQIEVLPPETVGTAVFLQETRAQQILLMTRLREKIAAVDEKILTMRRHFQRKNTEEAPDFNRME